MDKEIILQVGVKILLKNKEGKYLFLKRNPEKYKDMESNWWDIPGGRIEPGGSLLDNLKREVKEETSLNLLAEPKLVAAQDILRAEGRHVVRLTYVGEIDGEPKIDNDHLEAKWFTAEEIKKLGESELDLFFKELLDKKQINL